ncbi:MAG: M1 family metallopeptidase [Candidatus Aminicenantaceae bacterium]
MRYQLFSRIILFFLILFLVKSFANSEVESINEFISQIQINFANKNIPAYLSAFSPEIREKEERTVKNIFNTFRMDKVTLYRAGSKRQMEGKSRDYFQVLYENDYSALVEIWELSLTKVDERWQIIEKGVSGNLSILYKLKIPSDKIERVKHIEVKHADIKLSFDDALLFYDNITGLETALVILGKGRLRFSPSDPKEKHQLQLLYKKEILEDKLAYAYLRFSNTFFKKNIKIEKTLGKKPKTTTQAEINKAHSIFSKHYSRSFTIENSLSRELLSFLPQGEQAVFEFMGERVGVLTYIYSPFTEEEVSLIESKEKKVINLYSPRGGSEENKLFISLSQKFDISRYLIDVDFNPRQSFLSGKAIIEVETKVDYLDSLKLKIHPDLNILRIFDEGGNELFYTQDKLRKILYIYLIRSFSKKRFHRVEIYYRGKLKPPKQTADVIPGAQVEFDDSIGIPAVYHSHLFSQAAYWYPSPPDVDYFKARLKIIVPPDYVCIAIGELKEHRTLNDVDGVELIEKMGNSVYIFETKYPVKYLSFIVGKFSKVENENGSLPLEMYVSSNVRVQREETLEQVKEILEFYSTRFGPYPYEKLSVIKRMWSLSGGHSPPSFIVINELPQRRRIGKYLISSKSPIDLSRWKEYFIAHEIAHQWWGQGVTWSTYHDQWLSEGLAQFSAVLYLKAKRNGGIFSHILRKFSNWTEKKSKWGSITMGSRLSYHDFEAYQSIIYNKASLVLNMLMEMLGDELFFRGLKEYYNSHKYRGARTKDFINSMEKVSGRDLRVFFNGWFNSYLLPDIKTFHSIQKDENGFLLNFKFMQTKGQFVFPLWIEWKENGEIVRKKVIISNVREEFDFRLNEKPEKIKINPDRAIPGKFS